MKNWIVWLGLECLGEVEALNASDACKIYKAKTPALGAWQAEELAAFEITPAIRANLDSVEH